MQMSGFRSRVKLCKFESGNLAITTTTSQRRSCRLAQRRVPGIEKLSRNCVPHFNFTRVPPMNHNLRSIEALSRGVSRLLKQNGTEIVVASIVSAGPRQPAQLFLPRNVSIFSIPSTTIFATRPCYRFFFNFR